MMNKETLGNLLDNDNTEAYSKEIAESHLEALDKLASIQKIGEGYIKELEAREYGHKVNESVIKIVKELLRRIENGK